MRELNTAKANLASAWSTLDYPSANFTRYAALYKKGLIAANDYDQARLSYQQAREQVATARENVQKAQTNLGYATITSPIDGVPRAWRRDRRWPPASARLNCSPLPRI